MWHPLNDVETTSQFTYAWVDARARLLRDCFDSLAADRPQMCSNMNSLQTYKFVS